MSALSSACPPCTLASLLRGKWKWKWYCSLWQEALLTLCTNGKVSQSFEFVYNAEFVVGMFTAPNGQTQESTKTHFESKSRKSEKRMARKTECRTEYSTQYIQKYHIYVDGYLCPFVLLPSYVEIRNILCVVDHFRVSLEHVIPAMFTVPFLGIELFHTGCKMSKETAIRRVLQFDKNPFKILFI